MIPNSRHPKPLRRPLILLLSALTLSGHGGRGAGWIPCCRTIPAGLLQCYQLRRGRRRYHEQRGCHPGRHYRRHEQPAEGRHRRNPGGHLPERSADDEERHQSASGRRRRIADAPARELARHHRIYQRLGPARRRDQRRGHHRRPGSALVGAAAALAAQFHQFQRRLQSDPDSGCHAAKPAHVSSHAQGQQREPDHPPHHHQYARQFSEHRRHGHRLDQHVDSRLLDQRRRRQPRDRRQPIGGVHHGHQLFLRHGPRRLDGQHRLGRCLERHGD